VNLTIALAVIAASLFALAWTFQRRLMYFPFAGVPPPAEVGLDGAVPVSFDTSDGVTLGGWFVPGAGSPARFTVLVFNGNAGNRSFRAPLARALRALDLNVLLFDYRGFGDNPGTATEAGLREDARAALRFLSQRSDVDPTRVVLFGESLGSAVAIGLAMDHPPAALILRSPFTSMTELGTLHYPILPVRWLLRDRYPSIERIQQVSCPLLVIAGDSDSIVPPEQSRRLYDAAASHPKTFVMVKHADHNDEALLAGGDMINAIDLFLQGLDGKTR
jgi:fermentation-respiration switch protein FrsA (DUF1100 family)